ncbi:MAG: O-succinylhomoserine sulfhydrylase [Gammaproteobacteria bacterium]
MSKNEQNQNGFQTRAIRTAKPRTGEGEQSEPIFTTSSFVFDSAQQAEARFSGEEAGNIYSRFSNPTVSTFEKRMASLEEGERCVATSSGMAGIMAICLSLLKHGDHLLAAKGIFGSTALFFTKYLSRYGIDVDFVTLSDLDAWEKTMKPNTRLLFIETPSNPLGELVNIHALSAIAHKQEALLVVDNTVCTPALQKPLSLGADIVVLSATKYIDGQGRCVGGAVVGNNQLVGEEVYGFLRTAGPCLSPFNAWVFLKGLETLSLRMEAHSRAALSIAEWVTGQLSVEKVYYPGLSTHPQYELAKQQQRAFGGLLSFEVQGGRANAWKFINATRMISITANLGDAKTTVTHPATTTHGRLTPEARADAGIHDNLVRIAVGLEDVDDLKADIQRGFDALK